MDLTTTYLGLRLQHPLMPGASPMVDDLDVVKRLEDAGAAAITMHSLFEEQITREQLGTERDIDASAGSSAEAISYLPKPEDYRLGPEEYLDQIRKIKEAVEVPVIASLNGATEEGWLEYARKIEQAGADALELNVYSLATDPAQSSDVVERRVLNITRIVKHNVRIPVAVKLSPFYTSLANLARELDELKVEGLVLFNRFYQPDIDIENLEVEPTLQLSDSSELLLRLRWLAILSGRIRASLAASGGVHTPQDAIKAVMAGAHAVQVVSVLLKRGPQYLRELKKGMELWLEQHEYQSLQQAQGSMNLQKCPDPAGFERANYMRVLTGWR
jgi:dihydroorotate dehydrogenase (fumarate)